MNVASKVLGACLTIAGLVVVTGLIGYSSASSARTAAKQIVDHRMVELALINDLSGELHHALEFKGEFLRTRSPEAVTAHDAHATALADTTGKLQTELTSQDKKDITPRITADHSLLRRVRGTGGGVFGAWPHREARFRRQAAGSGSRR
jgi:hypothetical protein